MLSAMQTLINLFFLSSGLSTFGYPLVTQCGLSKSVPVLEIDVEIYVHVLCNTASKKVRTLRKM